MSDDTTILTRRRVLGGIAAVGIGSAAAGAGTMAEFFNEEETTGNTVTAGELLLDGVGSSAPSGFRISGNDLVPDDSGTEIGYFDLKNTGDVAGQLRYRITDWTDFENGKNEAEDNAGDPSGGNPGAGNGELSNKLEIDAWVDDTPGNGERNNNVHITSGFVGLSGGEVPTSVTINPGDVKRVWIDARIPSGTGNRVQTDGVEIDAKFYLYQV